MLYWLLTYKISTKIKDNKIDKNKYYKSVLIDSIIYLLDTGLSNMEDNTKLLINSKIKQKNKIYINTNRYCRF